MEGNEYMKKGGGSEARLSEIRRRLHQCPELDFALDETSTVVEEVLTENRYSLETSCRNGHRGFPGREGERQDRASEGRHGRAARG